MPSSEPTAGSSQRPPGPQTLQAPGIAVIIGIPIFAVLVFALGVVFVAHYTKARTHRAVALVHGELRSLAMAVEAYHADLGEFPAMAKSREWAAGAYVLPREVPVSRTFRMRHDTGLATLTTPVAYITSYPVDPFREFQGTTFSYYTDGRGFILGSWGPNMNQSLGGDLQWQQGSLALRWRPDPKDDAGDSLILDPDPGIETVYRGDIDQPSPHLLTGNHDDFGVGAFTYDPTNGVFSPGDIWRVRQ